MHQQTKLIILNKSLPHVPIARATTQYNPTINNNNHSTISTKLRTTNLHNSAEGKKLITILNPVLKKTNNTVLVNTSKTHVGTTKNWNLYLNENRTDIDNTSIKHKSIYSSTSHERTPENNTSPTSIKKIMRTNNSMNLTYSNKEINNQTTISNTPTNVNPSNITKLKIIMNTANKKSMYRKHTPNGKKQTQYFPNTKQNILLTTGVIHQQQNYKK